MNAGDQAEKGTTMSQTSDELMAGQWGTGELTESEQYDLLSDERRRTVLAALQRLDVPVDLSTLATEIAARDGPGTLNGETEEQVKITLHHNHLPKMADLGVLDYDPESNRIAL
jgi:hypothetical protein